MERAPNAWDRFYHYQEAPWRGERPISQLKPLLGEGRVLELGCGNGKLLRPLLAAGVDVIGLDISWNILRRLGQGVLADASALPFADGSFSAVMDFHCTGHLLADGRAAAMDEIMRVLEPGGRIICERLGRDDMRATKGENPEPYTRQLADGRTTHFSSVDSLEVELAAFAEHRFEELRYEQKVHGGRAARQSVQAVAVRP